MHYQRSLRRLSRRAFLSAAGLLGVLSVLPGGARASGSYLDGETLRIVIASGVGSGNDAVGHFFAKHLAAQLPSTEITVENVGGGAGRLAEKILFDSPPDGLTIVFLRSSMFYRILFAPQDYPYDLSSFSWVGSLSRERRVLLVTTKSGIHDVASLQAFEGPVRLAADSVSSTSYQESLYLNAMLGCRLLPVPGYDAGARDLSILSGEVEARISNYESVLPLIEAGAGTIALQLNGDPLPEPFTATEHLHELPIDPKYDWLLDLMAAESNLGRIVAAAPGVPPERMAALQGYFMAVARDPTFVAQAKEFGLLVDPVGGDALQAQMSALPAANADLVARLEAVKACGLQIAETGKGCATE